MMTNTPTNNAHHLSLFNKIHELEVHTPQGLSGSLIKESQYVFNYDKVSDSLAISLTMPIRAKSYSSGDLLFVFAMNRPEGYLRYIIEEKLKRLGAPSDMFLLYLAGSNQIGRLTYALPGEPAPQTEGERLEELLSSPSGVLFERLINQYAMGSGISGMQPKTLVPIAGDTSIPEHTALPLKTVIVKAEGIDYHGIARNEFFCMSVAKEAKLDVPGFWLSNDGKLFIMDRFDRTPDGTALGFEDFAVLTGRTVEKKYEGSYEMIATAVGTYAGTDSVAQLKKLFERVAISCLLRDGDAHLKNFGMIYEHPAAPRKLAPIYDVVCTDIYPELDGYLALKMNGQKTFPSTDDLIRFARRVGIKEGEADQIIRRINDAYHKTLLEFEHDPRYQEDDLLSRIKDAIERISPRNSDGVKI